MSSPTRVDLSNCDREPIHVPGSIQPHGCLLACDATAARVLRHSANAVAMLGLDGEPNGASLDAVLGLNAAHAVRNTLARSGEPTRAALSFGMGLSSGRIFDIAAHRHESSVLIEFEPVEADGMHPLEMARSMIGRVFALDHVDRLVRDTARLIQAMLGYDRVMVYQFSHDGSGKVVSEAKRTHLESFLGQYFPASDIPQQARTLYLRNTIRIIPDIDFEPIGLMPVLDDSGNPLDLSYAHLRSVSPIHCEYLRNMGVAASMSISIVVDGALWGLIACHHYSPRKLSMSRRVAAEMFGEFFSLHLHTLKQKHKLEAAMRARQLLDRFLRDAAWAADIEAMLRGGLDDFASLVPCDGVGMWLNGRWSGRGSGPPEAAISGLVDFIGSVADGKVWATHALASLLPGAEDYSDACSGVLAIPLSQRPRDYLLFFRKELVHTLNWAGNPDKAYQTGPLGDRLTPRKSFAIWKETVHRQAEPWSDAAHEIAEAARVALVEVVLHHNELLADERSRADLRRRMLNEELNHRVKNILAVIKSVVNHPSRDGESLDGYAASLRGRIQAIAHAHDQVIRGDGGGSLRDLVHAELIPYQNTGCAVEVDGPPALLDARAFAVLALVLHELATNAAKYGVLSGQDGRLAVRWRYELEGDCAIEWRESGGPPVTPPDRPGFGTQLIKRSIPFDLGGRVRLDYLPDGLHATFHIPATYVAREAPAPSSRAAPVTAPPAVRKADVSGARVLVVEDQLLIAMDLEQILGGHGVAQVDTAASPAEALRKLQAFTPDVAILDVNLGGESCAPVADELARRQIPFAFATGYSDRSQIPERFLAAPVVRKPFEADSVIGQVSELMRRP